MLATSTGGHPAALQELGDIATGSAKAAVLKYSLKVRRSDGRFGLPTIKVRAPSPPPTKLTPGDSLKLIPCGAPLSKVVISAACQPAISAWTTGLGSSWLTRGTSYRKWNVKMLRRSY